MTVMFILIAGLESSLAYYSSFDECHRQMGPRSFCVRVYD